MTIRLRLALLFTAAALVLLLAGGTLFVTDLEAGLEQSLTQTLNTAAYSLTSRLGTVRTPAAIVQAVRHGLRGSARGTFAQLVTAQGEVLSSTRGIPDDALLSPAQVRYAEHHTLVLDRNVSLRGPTDSGLEPMRVLAKQINHTGVVVVVAISRDVVDEAVASSRTKLILLGLGVLALAGPGSWLLTRAALRPVERMRVEVRDLHARNADAGLRVPDTRDEIARLAQTFNGLLSRLHDALSREQALVADAGHELRTPLTVLKGELELARRPGRTRDELAETVEVAAEETDRLVRLAEDLLFLSTQGEGNSTGARVTGFDVVQVVDEAVQASTVLAGAHGVSVRLAAEPVIAVGNPAWIRRAVDNLLVNALRYGHGGTEIDVTVTLDRADVRVGVRDHGPGFPPQFLPSAFERFTRADDARGRSEAGPAGPADPGGSGLGLAIVRSIIARHGGTATAANCADGGAEVVLRWPAAGATSARPR